MSNKLCLWKFFWDCGRMGSLDGMFFATESQMLEMYGNQIYFGEVLGKHSEIYGTLEEKDVELVTDDPNDIEVLTRVLGTGTISGFNPFDYYEPRCGECGCELCEDEEERGICNDCQEEMRSDEGD